MALTLIGHEEVGAIGANSISFSGISGYDDLWLIGHLRTNAGGVATDCQLSINGNQTGHEYISYQSGGNPTATSNNQTAGRINAAGSDAATFSPMEIFIPNAGTTSNSKVWWARSAAVQDANFPIINYTAARRASTGAITSLSVAPVSGSFVQYSTLTLYGVKRNNDGSTTVG